MGKFGWLANRKVSRFFAMPVPAKLTEILEELALFPDRVDRIEALLAIAGEFRNPSISELPRSEVTRVPGCESDVFIRRAPAGTERLFEIAVDNPQGISAMALARILQRATDGQPLDQVAAIPEDIVFTIFGTELSMGKSLGLTGMVRMVTTLAKRGSPA